MKVKFSVKDYIRKHAVFWSFTPEYYMFSDVILKGKLLFSYSVCIRIQGKIMREYQRKKCLTFKSNNNNNNNHNHNKTICLCKR